MSTTRFVNALSDLLIFSRPVAGNPGQTEWVMRLDAVNQTTGKVEVFFEVISGDFLAFAVKYDAAAPGYQVTTANLPEGGINSNSAHEIISSVVSYDFQQGLNNQAKFVVIEDISMMLTAVFEGPAMNDRMVILHIEDGSNPGAYRHRIWHLDSML